jgi:hypothetical protein
MKRGQITHHLNRRGGYSSIGKTVNILENLSEAGRRSRIPIEIKLRTSGVTVVVWQLVGRKCPAYGYSVQYLTKNAWATSLGYKYRVIAAKPLCLKRQITAFHSTKSALNEVKFEI